MAGLRIATVTVISLATVAAYVCNQGLGQPIFDAIGNNVFKTELIAAGAPGDRAGHPGRPAPRRRSSGS